MSDQTTQPHEMDKDQKTVMEALSVCANKLSNGELTAVVLLYVTKQGMVVPTYHLKGNSGVLMLGAMTLMAQEIRNVLLGGASRLSPPEQLPDKN